MKIAIDIGHNCPGVDTGAVSDFGSEDALVLQIGQRVCRKLIERGHVPVTVLPAHPANLNASLSARADLANKAKADIFVSLHFNAHQETSEPRGVEAYAISSAAKAIAACLVKSVAEIGLKVRGVKEARFAVLNKTTMPAVLLEIAFVDSAADMAIVERAGFDRIADAIVQGLVGKLDTSHVRTKGKLEILTKTVGKPSPAQSATLKPGDCVEYQPGIVEYQDCGVGEGHVWIVDSLYRKLFFWGQHVRFVAEGPPAANPNRIVLGSSVGVGGVNAGREIGQVRSKLYRLGFRQSDGDRDIQLFQSIVFGKQRIEGIDGRIDPDGETLKWLNAKNAPCWVLMPRSDPSINFVNCEWEQVNDDHDWGTNWLFDAIVSIAQDFHAHSDGIFAINDVSRPMGGDTPDHAGHETGLSCDVLLPQKGKRYGGIDWQNSSYDRQATGEILQAIKRHPLTEVIYFNDRGFIAVGLCQAAVGHDDHIHFQIRPPARQE